MMLILFAVVAACYGHWWLTLLALIVMATRKAS